MKKQTKLKILRILFVISLIISLLLISNTYAKYQEQVDTSYKSTIKRWKMVVNDKIIREQTSLTEVVEPILINNEYVKEGVIVPGSESYFNMDINFAEVDVPFTVEFTLEQDESSEIYNELPDFKFYGYYVEENDTFYYNLPEEYQQVEYIESSGTQYIDTNIVADSNNIETIIQFEPLSVTGNMWLGGSDAADVTVIEKDNTETEEEGDTITETIINGKTFSSLPYIENNVMKFYAGASENIYSEEIELSKWYKVSQKYGEKTLQISVNDEDTYKYDGAFSGTIQNGENFWLFANNSKVNDFGYSSIRIKEFKYKINDMVSLDLVPCYRKADNVVGMYDMVTGKFFTNAGTGTFAKGEDVEKVIIDPGLEKYKDLTDEEKVSNVKAYIRWVDGDGTTESPIDEMNNVEDTNFIIDLRNTHVRYKATAIFEQYIKEYSNSNS